VGPLLACVIPANTRQVHAVLHCAALRCPCRSLDAALVSPGRPQVLPVVREKPDLTQGVSFLLMTNTWGERGRGTVWGRRRRGGALQHVREV